MRIGIVMGWPESKVLVTSPFAFTGSVPSIRAVLILSHGRWSILKFRFASCHWPPFIMATAIAEIMPNPSKSRRHGNDFLSVDLVLLVSFGATETIGTCPLVLRFLSPVSCGDVLDCPSFFRGGVTDRA